MIENGPRLSEKSRGDAAAATWTFRGDRVAATPRVPRGYSAETGSRRRRGCRADIPRRQGRGDAAGATRIFRGDRVAAGAARIFRGDGSPRVPRGYSAETGSRRCRGRDVDILRRQGRGDAAAATRIFRGDRVAATPRPRRGYSAETGSPRVPRGYSAETSPSISMYVERTTPAPCRRKTDRKRTSSL